MTTNRQPGPPSAHPTAPKASPAPSPPQVWECKPGKVVFKEGEESYDLLILEEGEVEVFVGEERRAVMEGPGVFLGEIGALLRRPRSAKVRALSGCRFTVYKDFESLMANDPGKLLDIARGLAEKLADANESYEKQVGLVFALLKSHHIKASILADVDAILGGEKEEVTASPRKKHLFGLF